MRLRRAMQREDFSLEQIVGEFAVRWGFRPRQAWRHGHGMTQDEVAAEYNVLIGDPRAPMSGKRISDFEAWPVGGVKPTLHTLSVLAQLYGTQPHSLVDFADYEAMTRTERVALRGRDDNMTDRDLPGATMVRATADTTSGWAGYLKCFIRQVECRN